MIFWWNPGDRHKNTSTLLLMPNITKEIPRKVLPKTGKEDCRDLVVTLNEMFVTLNGTILMQLIYWSKQPFWSHQPVTFSNDLCIYICVFSFYKEHIYTIDTYTCINCSKQIKWITIYIILRTIHIIKSN